VRLHASTISRPSGRQPHFHLDDEADMQRYERALIAIERHFPVLNPDSLDYRESLMFEVYDLMKQLFEGGLAPAVALESATRKVLRPIDRH
jgi:hypothetical protein